MNYLTLFLTELCNKKCSYCDIGQIENKKKPNKPTIKKFIPIIKKSNWNNIVLTGGEVSLLDSSTLEFIIYELKDKFLKVNTNGLWFKFKYFEKYYEVIDSIQYHPVSEINESFDIITDKKIIYYFPVHRNNIKYLNRFLSKNVDITIRLAPYDMKFLTNNFSLNKEHFIQVSEIIEKYNNVTDDTKKMFSFLAKGPNINLLKKCCFYPSIDFVNCRIKKCIKSHTLSEWIPLTEKNFNNMQQLKYIKSDICSDCYLLARDFEKLIRMLVCLD